MKTQKRKIGDIGENFAVEYLKQKKHLIIDQNYLKPFGEIDIVAKKNRNYVFIEVKTSIFYENSEYSPEKRVNKTKLAKLIKICQFYFVDKIFQSKHVHQAECEQNWQIDVISVILNKDLTLKILNTLKILS